MTHKFYSKIVLAFTICLIPLSLYSIEYEEALENETQLIVVKKSIEQICFAGKCLFAISVLSKLNTFLNYDSEIRVKLEVTSFVSDIAFAIILGNIMGVNSFLQKERGLI